MRDPRYWASGHPERQAYAAWVTEGWQRLASSPHRTADGAAVVFVRAYSRVRNGRTEHVGAYTRAGHPGDAGSSGIVPVAERRRPDGIPGGQRRPEDILEGGAGGGGAFRNAPSGNNRPGSPQPPQAAPRSATPARPPTTVEEMRNASALENRTKGSTNIWRWPGGGGRAQANAQFDSMPLRDVRDIGTKWGPGRRGELPDGRRVIVRPSTEGRHTIEIQRPNGIKSDEFRF